MITEPNNLNRELLRSGDPKSPLVVTLSHFNGMRGVDVRKHYFDKATGETKPSGKGVWLKEDEFLEIYELFISQADQIASFFRNDLNPSELNNRSRLLEQNARRTSLDSSWNVTCSVEEWPGTKFFNYINQGNKHHIALNSKHEVFKSMSLDCGELVSKILYAYIKAKNNIDIKNSEQIINFVEVEWGNQVGKINL